MLRWLEVVVQQSLLELLAYVLGCELKLVGHPVRGNEGIRRDEWVEDGSEGGRVGGRQSVEQVGRRTYNNGKRKRVAHLFTCYFL